MKRRRIKEEESHLDSATVFFTVISLVLIAIGLFLNFIATPAVGISSPDKYGRGGGRTEVLSGTSVIVMGLLVAILPLKDCLLYLKDKFFPKKQ